jgi:hypothetical protein
MRSIISTLIVGIMFMLLAVVFLTTVLRTSADYAAKTSQAPPYKPGHQPNGDSSSAPAAAELRGNGDQAVRSARPPDKAGREADEQSDNSTASGK